MAIKEETDKRLEELRSSLDEIKGTKCEVYTRIVGYYRNVENFNIGKKEEYKERKMFNPVKGVDIHTKV